MKTELFKIESENLDLTDVLLRKDKIRELLDDDGFIIKLKGFEADSFYILFQDYLEKNHNYCGINDLCVGGAEPYNEDSDGDVRISYDGLVENWYYNFWMPETELTNGQSEIPLRVKLSGYFILEDGGHVFYPSVMVWNEENLLEATV